MNVVSKLHARGRNEGLDGHLTPYDSWAAYGTSKLALVHEARAAQPETEGVVILRPQADGARVERLGDHAFRLVGRQVERVVALNDVTTPEALSYIDHQLKRLGVPRLLARAGVTDGDTIWIASFSFDYQQDS